MHSQLYRNSLESRILDGVILIILTVVAAVTLYPLVYTVVTSFHTALTPNRFFYLWPDQPQLIAYKVVLRNQLFLRGFLNSTFYTVAGASLSVVLTMLTAYPLSLRSFPLR